MNNNNKSNKFSSALLNRPFSSKKDFDDVNMTNISSSSINIGEKSEIDHSLVSSIDFSKKDSQLTKEYDQSQTTDDHRSTTTQKKRKPFDKLTFNKEHEESAGTSAQLNENNTTQISFKERSSILTFYNKTLTNEILDKARQYNSQFTSNPPFWIKFFEDVNNDVEIKFNSSYLRSNDKDKYIGNLIEMVKRDAELFDRSAKHQKIKSEVQDSIKGLMLTEIKLNSEEDKESSSNGERNDDKIITKFAEMLITYEKGNQKDKKLAEVENNFDEYKASLLNEGKHNTKYTKEEVKKVIEMDEMLNEPTVFSDKEIKLIDALQFDPNDNFSTINYPDVEFGCLRQSSVGRLMEIDRRLNEINPKVYQTSFNNVLKDIQNNFNENKTDRLKVIDENYRQHVEKLKTKQKKRETLFDIKLPNEEKIKYKDYLRQADKRFNQSEEISKIDKKIKQFESDIATDTYKVSPQAEEEMQREIERMRGESAEPKHIEQFEKYYCMRRNFDQVVSTQNSNKNKLNEIATLLEEEKKREAEFDFDKLQVEMRSPFEELMRMIEKEEEDNRMLMQRSDRILSSLRDGEDELGMCRQKVDELIKDKENYIQMWEEADKIFNYDE